MSWDFPQDRELRRRYLLDAVESVRAVVLAGVEQAEEKYTLPPASFDALYEAGLFWLKLPTALGGAEADPLIQIEVIAALAEIDASAAWSVMVGSQSTGLPAAWLPDDALGVVFGDGRTPVAAGSLMPSGTAERVDGGYRVSGRWALPAASNTASGSTPRFASTINQTAASRRSVGSSSQLPMWRPITTGMPSG